MKIFKNKKIVILLLTTIATLNSKDIKSIKYFDEVKYLKKSEIKIISRDKDYYSSKISNGEKNRISNSILEPKNEIVVGAVSKNCNYNCQNKLLINHRVLKLLYYSQYNRLNPSLYIKFLEYASTVNMKFNSINSNINVAILIQENIKNATKSIIKTVEAYSIYRNININVKVFYASSSNIKKKIKSIASGGYTNIISIIGLKLLDNIIYENFNSNIKIFIPTLNNIDLNINRLNNNDSISDKISSEIEKTVSKNIFFTGISYKNQVEALLKYTSSNVINISNETKLSNDINNYILNNSIINRYKVVDSILYSKFKKVNLKNNYVTSLNNSSIFLNIPVNSSATVLSKFSYYNIIGRYILSTQLNYNINIVGLVSPPDLSNLIVANSIINTRKNLVLINDILGVDINYDLINYTTNVTLDLIVKNNLDKEFIFNENLTEDGLRYEVKLYKYIYKKLVPIHFTSKYKEKYEKNILSTMDYKIDKNTLYLPRF